MEAIKFERNKPFVPHDILCIQCVKKKKKKKKKRLLHRSMASRFHFLIQFTAHVSIRLTKFTALENYGVSFQTPVGGIMCALITVILTAAAPTLKGAIFIFLQSLRVTSSKQAHVGEVISLTSVT